MSKPSNKIEKNLYKSPFLNFEKLHKDAKTQRFAAFFKQVC